MTMAMNMDKKSIKRVSMRLEMGILKEDNMDTEKAEVTMAEVTKIEDLEEEEVKVGSSSHLKVVTEDSIGTERRMMRFLMKAQMRSTSRKVNRPADLVRKKT